MALKLANKDGNTYVVVGDDDVVRIGTAGSERVTIDENGNVKMYGNVRIYSSSDVGGLNIDRDNADFGPYVNFYKQETLVGRVHSFDGTYFGLYYGSTPSLGLGINASDGSIYIPNKLGIGTSSPATTLQVNTQSSTARFLDSVNNRQIDINPRSLKIDSNSVLYLNRDSAGNVILVNGGGNVGIGTTPSYKLDVNGTIKSKKIRIENNDPNNFIVMKDIDTNDNFTFCITDGGDLYLCAYDYSEDVSRNIQYWYPDTGHSYIKNLDYCNISDITCACFKHYNDDELIKIVNLQPREDGIVHKSDLSGKVFPHIDFNKVHDDVSAFLNRKEFEEEIYKYDKTKKDYVKTKIKYKKGEKYGIDFGSLVYAMAELVYRLSNKVNQLEEQLNALRLRGTTQTAN
ncbi:MAG: hypothetical protein ACTSRL_22050 [Candidatus Helarchaeota archaeon]